MEQIIVTHRDSTTLKLNSKENVSAVSKATQTVELLGADVVDISVNSAKKLSFYIGDKITVIGRDYTLNTPARERKISENEFQYDLQFEGVQYDLLRATFNVNINTTTNAIQDISGDSVTGNIKMFLDILVSNANRVFGSGKWLVGSYPTDTKTITLTFNDSDNCLTVLQNLCIEENFNAEFKIGIDASGIRTINIGTFGNTFGNTFQYGKGKGIYDLTRQKISSSNIITRLNCYGGSKNIITPKYRASKLCLATKSKSQSFIEDATAISKYGVWESTKDFNDIYPRRTGTVSALGSNVYDFIDSSMTFDINEKNVDGTTKYLMDGTACKISFTTGNLAGYEFQLSKYDAATKKFTIISQTDENDYTFPSTTSAAFKIAIGDQYIISEIYMPQAYIDTAEAELATRAAAYLAKYSQPLVQYGLTVDSFFLKNQVGADAQSNIVWVGDYIPIKDTDLEVEKTIRVKGFTRDLMKDYAYQLTIADLSITVSTINRVVSGMNLIDKVIKINDLNDPAKARRNWKDSQEVLNMVFDTEGDFYTDKIKPLSIQTSMLSVGAKSMQFGLEAIIFQPNYAANKNRVVYSGGSLVHYSILDISNNPMVWTITSGDTIITTDTARYVYAKCSKSASGGTILFSTDKISVESDASYYHFLIGILNSVDANNTRALALMYGFTTINGRFIKTGRIQSADGVTYFDLDAGEFKGNFKFTTGETIQQAIATAAANIKVGGRNLYTGTWKDDKAFGGVSAGYCFPIGYKTLTELGLLVGDEVTISSIATLAGASVYKTIFAFSNGTTTTYVQGVDVTSGTRSTLTSVIPAGTVSFAFYYSFATSATTLNCKLIKLERGNKQTDWDTEIEYLSAAMQANTSVEGGLLSTTLLQVKDNAGNVTGGISGLATDNVVLFGGGTYNDALASDSTPSAVAVIDRKDGSGHRAKGALLWDKLGNLTVGFFKVVAGALTGYEGLYERIRITTQSITSLSALISGGWIREAKDYLFTNAYAGNVYNGYSDTNLTCLASVSDSAYISIPIATNIKIYSGGNLSYVLNNSTGITFNFTKQKFTISGVGTYYLTSGQNQTIALAAGSYTISYTIEASFDVAKYKSSQVNLSNTTAAYVEVQSVAPSRTEIGSNGFFSFWSTSQYFFYDKTNGLEIKGVMNIPGVLATGSIGSTGTHTNKWGAKVSSSNATYTATGIYDVIHAVGTTAYSVSVQPTSDGNNAFVISKSTTSFRIQIRNNSGTAAAGTFDYTIYGTN